MADVDGACDVDEVDIDDVEDVCAVDIYIYDADDVKRCTRCSAVCNVDEVGVDHLAD